MKRLLRTSSGVTVGLQDAFSMILDVMRQAWGGIAAGCWAANMSPLPLASLVTRRGSSVDAWRPWRPFTLPSSSWGIRCRFICICVHVCVQVREAYSTAYTWRSEDRSLGCGSSSLSNDKIGSLLFPLCSLAWLSHKVLGIPPALPPITLCRHWDYRCMVPWVLGIWTHMLACQMLWSMSDLSRLKVLNN